MEREWKRPNNLFVPDINKVVFVIIDMQNFSCAPITRKPLPHINAIIRQINHLVDFCRDTSIPIIWVKHNFTITDKLDNSGLFPLFHDKKDIGSIANHKKGTDIYAAMHFERTQDYVVLKNRYSAFLADPPELQTLLKRLRKNQLLIAGVAANVCVESTLRDAMQLDYEVTLISDGTTATTEAAMESTTVNTYQFFGDVRTVSSTIQVLKAQIASTKSDLEIMNDM